MIPTQTEIVLRLAELSRLLDAATLEVAVLDEEAVRAKQAHEVASARAYLTAEGYRFFRPRQEAFYLIRSRR